MPSHAFYLVLRELERSPYLGASIHARKPRVPAGAVLMELHIDVPSSLFRKPVLRASVTLPESELSDRITAQVASELGAELSRQIGVRVEVAPSPEEKA